MNSAYEVLVSLTASLGIPVHVNDKLKSESVDCHLFCDKTRQRRKKRFYHIKLITKIDAIE